MIKQQKVHQKYLFLGTIQAEVQGSCWELWNRKLQYTLYKEPKIMKTQTYTIDQIRTFHTYPCQIKSSSQEDNAYCYYAQYSLEVSSKDNLQKNILQNLTFFDGINHHMKQLEDQRGILLFDPICLPLQTGSIFHNFYANYQLLESLKKYKIKVHVWLDQQILFDCNQHEELNIQWKMKQHHNKGFLNNYEYKKNDSSFYMKLDYLVSVLKAIEQKNDKIQAAYKMSQNQASQQLIPQDQDLSPDAIKQLINQNDKEEPQKVIPYNLTTQIDPGEYFDLINCQFELYQEPPTFKGKLLLYQRKALTWMLYRQGFLDVKSFDQRSLDIPFWRDFKPIIGYDILYNSTFQELVYNKMITKRCKGGILADDMGLGKTIMLIALILSHLPSSSNSKQTLVIVPVSLIPVWKNKLAEFAPELNVYIFHGSNRKIDSFDQYDVIITSQSILRSQKQKSSKDEALTDYEWFRIIIDEAHNIRNHQTKMANAIYSLKAEYRWCLTGTPKQNSTRDIYSFCKFLRMEPWSNIKIWDAYFPKKDKDVKQYHIVQLKQILKGIMLRRKKNSLDEKGDKLLQLPKIDIKIHYVKMSQQARDIYRIINQTASQRLKVIDSIKRMKEDPKLQSKNPQIQKIRKKMLNKRSNYIYTSVLGLMIKMRMVCCHALLQGYCKDFISFETFKNQYLRFLGKKKVSRVPKHNFFEEWLKKEMKRGWKNSRTTELKQVYSYWEKKFESIARGNLESCFICSCIQPNMKLTPCLHFFCEECINQYFHNLQQKQNASLLDQEMLEIKEKISVSKIKQYLGQCPKCKEELKLTELYPVPRQNQFGIKMSGYKPNQKISQLLKYLLDMKENDKAIVYTSFIGMILLIGESLSRNHIEYLQITGADPLVKRQEKIHSFSNDLKYKVLLITLKIGSVGLNLQAANKIFIMDPWWNPAIQEQAIARAYRFGQQKQVLAVKFATQQSIQAKIIKDSHNKKSIIDSLLDIDDIGTNQSYKKTRPEIQYLLQMQEDEDNTQRQNMVMEEQGQQYEYIKLLRDNMMAKKENTYIKKVIQDFNDGFQDDRLDEQNMSKLERDIMDSDDLQDS